MINIKALLTLGTKGTDKAKKEVTDVNKQLDQAADNAERMNRARGKTPGETKQYRTQRSIAGTRGAEGRNFSGLASMAEGGLSGSFVGAYASLAANIFAVTAAFQALSNAARVEQLTKGLELMGARGGVALTQTAKNLQSVTDNAISAADAMKATAQASAAGFSGDEIARLGQVARGASLALGRDMSDALDRLTKGAIKLEPELLDELGIMTRLDDAVRVYAAANNKAVSSLTQTERRQAFLNAVLAEGERKFGDINEQIEANPYDQLSATVRQTSTDLAILANNILKPIATFFANNPFALAIPAIFLLGKAFDGLGISAKVAGLNMEKTLDGVYLKGDIASKSKKVRDIFGSVATKIEANEIKVTNVRQFEAELRKAEAAIVQTSGALTLAEKASLRWNKALISSNFIIRGVAVSIRALGLAIKTAFLPLLIMTAAMWAISEAFNFATKAWDEFTGQTKEIKQSKARMKELAEQAESTASQIRLMTQPGKEQQALAFDAMTNSAKAAIAELDAYIAIQERRIEIEEKGLKVSSGLYTVSNATGGGRKANNLTLEEANKKAEEFANDAYKPVITEKLISEEQAYTKIRDKAMEALNIDKDRADLLISQYKIRLASLPPEKAMLALSSMLTMNTADFGKYLLEGIRSSANISANFKDMEESGKKVTDATRDLFPKKTISAASKVAEGFKEILTNIAAGPQDGEDIKQFNMGLAAKAADLGPTIRDNVTALKAQGIELGQHQGTLDKIKAVEKAREVLATKKLGTDEKATAQAQTQVDKAQEILANDKEGIVALLTTFEIEQRILGVISQINAEKLKTYALESQIAKQAGDNAKSALEYEQTIKDTKRLEAGLDLNIPEELTIDYRLKIAEIEKNTASTIAGIKKKTLELEAQQQKIEIASEIARLEKTLEDSGKQRLSGLSDKSLQALIKNPNADRDQALTEIQIRLQEELSALQDEALEFSKAGAGYESLKAEGAFKKLEAEKKGLNPIKLAAKYALEELETLQEKQAILTSNADSLSMGAQLSNQVTSLLKATELPALQQKLAIAKQNVIEQENYIKDNKNLNADLLAFNQRELKTRQDKEASINAQIDGINQIVDSAVAGNIAEAASLDIQDKKLGILREQAGAMKALNDAQLNLNRAQAEARATAQGRELSASEQGALKANELKSQIEGIIGLPIGFMGPPTKEQAMSEMALLEQERDLLIKRSKLEEALFTIRFAAAEQELKNAIADAPAGSDTSKARGALSMLQSLDFTSVFAEERAAILSNKELERQTLQARADALKAEYSVTPTTPEQVGNQILLGITNELRGAFSGFGLTGKGADFFASESSAVLNNAKLDPDEQERQIALIRKKAFEIQQLQTLTEGLQSIFEGLGDSIADAFVGAIDGSKKLGQAFGEMAQQILRDLAAMIIKMIVFKTIEMGLNLIPGIGPGLSAGFKALTGAAGGVIPMATGGVMDRAMGVQGVVKQPTYLVGEGRYNEAVVPLPNGRAIPVQMHGGGSQSNNVAVTVNMTNNGSQTQTEGPDAGKMGQAIAAAVQRELIAQKAPGGLLNRYSTV
jgi:hypothetical protein